MREIETSDSDESGQSGESSGSGGSGDSGDSNEYGKSCRCQKTTSDIIQKAYSSTLTQDSSYLAC